MRSIGALGLVAVSLIGCAPQAIPSTFIPKPYVLSPAEKAAVVDGVRRSLKDPMSAMFGDVAAATREDGFITVCGGINARNSFGGYVGMQPYFGLLSTEPVPFFSVASMGGPGYATEATSMMCGAAGLKVI